MTEPKYPPEVILKYRELNDASGFDREIVKREPVNLEQDRLTLGCGHSTRKSCNTLAMTLNLSRLKMTEVVKGAGEKQQQAPKVRCDECAMEWLAEALRKA
jgi:hypothetical protein